jgi:thiol-disulfide isomerase/thioredoxin
MRVIYSVLFTLVCCFGYAQSQVTFGGVIKNPTGDTIYITSKNFKKALVPNAQGLFKETFTIEKGLYDLQYGDEAAGLYFNEGYDLTLDADARDFSQTLTFSGKGKIENNFLASAGKEINTSDVEAMNKMSMMYLATDKDFKEAMQKQGEESRKEAAERKAQRNALKDLNGKASPEFAYENAKGKIVKLKDFKGKYIYIDVWATWCGPCKMEIPHLQQIEEKLKGKNIAFVSISVDKRKDLEKWKKMVTEKSLGGTQLIADKDWQSDFIKAFGINSIPRFLIISPDGKIIDADAKRPSNPELITELNALLKE